jgi:hypothetical protein
MSEQLPKKVRITKAQFDHYWYAKRIGDVFKVRGETDIDYVVKHEDITDVYYVDKSDCEPIYETPEITATEGDDKSIIDLLANLARRVTELENGVAKQHAINRGVSDCLTMSADNLRTFAEQTESNTHDIAFLEDKIEGAVEDVYPELSRFSPLQRTILASDLPLDLALMLVNEAQEIEDINRKRVENSRPNVGVAE